MQIALNSNHKSSRYYEAGFENAKKFKAVYQDLDLAIKIYEEIGFKENNDFAFGMADGCRELKKQRQVVIA